MADIDLSAYATAQGAAIDSLGAEFLAAVKADDGFVSGNKTQFAGADRNAFKDIVSISINTNMDTIDTALKNLITYAPPERPPILDADIDRYTSHVYEDSNLDLFETTLRAIFAQDLPPDAYQFNSEMIQEAIQSARYDLGFDILMDATETEVHDIASAWAEDGYVMAPGAMGFQIAEKLGSVERQRFESTKGIFVQLGDVIQKNMRHALEQGVAIEKLHMDFAIRFSNVMKEIIEAASQAYIAEIEKRKDELVASLQSLDNHIKVKEAELGKDTKEMQLELDQALARQNVYTSGAMAYVDAQASTTSQQINLGSNIARGYQSLFESYGLRFTGISIQNATGE